jgi:hypothetical protein
MRAQHELLLVMRSTFHATGFSQWLMTDFSKHPIHSAENHPPITAVLASRAIIFE